ncbi:MAG: Stp1/IreP family PP2C-type Ser/Thr phosphatase [Deltaproteobacteria bacterium]|nr:Stp1/IreP family PP2C-type Ser/Thr phosphatase [Deltaproteobacteria bacterium]
MSLNLIYYGKSDVGLKRSNNEDAYIVEPDLGFCAVADGMGGAAAGEIASHIFTKAAQDVFAETGPYSEERRMDLMQKTFGLANQRILDHIKTNPQHAGMGCTAELLAFSETSFVLGHMGDSRTYRLRNDQLKQITQDHSLVQDQIAQGLITPDEARRHPLRHVILRAVGTSDTPSLDLIRGKLCADDIFLLCSDGLTDMVDDEKIKHTLDAGNNLEQVTDELIEIAKSFGGKDNITVVLCKFI